MRTIAWRVSAAADDTPASADHLWTMTSGTRHVAGQVERQAALLWFRWPAWRCDSCTVSDPTLVISMSPEPLIPTGVLAVGQNAGHQVLVKVLCGWRGTTGHFEWQQARQPRAVFAGSNANKLNRLGAAFSCKVSDPAFVVGMRTVPLIPAGIWKPSSMSVINCR